MLEQLVDGFILHRESEGRSQRTLDWHQNALGLFVQWIRANELSENPVEWDATLIRKYFVHLRERPSRRGNPLTPYTIRNYATSVRAFCRWLHDEEIVAKSPAERVSAPKTPILVQEPFELSEIKLLLATAKADKRTGLRDYALVLFMLDTGCRAGEVVGVRSDDINWSQRLAKVFGKGSKERIVFFSLDTLRAMQKYQLRARTGESDCFFKTEEGRTLTDSGILHITKRLGKRAGVEDVHPHKFRHTFAITFLRSGGSVLALQRILGHTTLAMTQRYVAMVSDDLQREHKAHSPVSFMLR